MSIDQLFERADKIVCVCMSAIMNAKKNMCDFRYNHPDTQTKYFQKMTSKCFNIETFTVFIP